MLLCNFVCTCVYCSHYVSKVFVLCSLCLYYVHCVCTMFVCLYSSSLLLIKRYNLFKVLACSTTFFQLSLFCATFFQLCTYALYIFQNFIFPTYFRSSNWSFRHGFPSLDLLHIVIFGNAFNMAQPVQSFLINPIIFCPFNMSLISWLVLVLQ